MTAETMPAVTVTQADRALFCELFTIRASAAARIMSGEADAYDNVAPMLANIARHREAAMLEGARLMQEAAAKVADKRAQYYTMAAKMNLPVEPSPMIAKDRGKVASDLCGGIRALDHATVLRNAAGGDA